MDRSSDHQLTRAHRRRRGCELEARRYCALSDSTSQTQANTTNIDKRISGGADSTIVSADNSNVTVTDAGAVHASFGFASDVFSKALDSITSTSQQSIDAAQKSEQTVADAYTTAKAGEQKVLVGVGIAIVGVVAVAALRAH